MKNVIIITPNELGKDESWNTEFETWGSLTEACEVHGFSYNYLKRLKFPFSYRGLNFYKVPHRTKRINH